jgi:predicted TPR repeat methyltransferase
MAIVSIQTSPNKLIPYLVRARDASNIDECMAIYECWATTYNSDLSEDGHNYVAPVLVAQLAYKLTADAAGAAFLDAGCGTGLVGQALARLGADAIDGLDFSLAMLDEAEQTGAYQNLIRADLTQRLNIADATYDTVTCVGTFTHGHVGPAPALCEFLRICKPGGLVVATVIEPLWDNAGFKTEVARIEAGRMAEVVQQEVVDYVKGRGDKAVLVVLRKNAVL